jgi:hypothetical protein
MLCIREERIGVMACEHRGGVMHGIPAPATDSSATLHARLVDVIYTGASYVLTCDCGEGLKLKSRLSAQQFDPGSMDVGSDVVLALPSRDMRLLDHSATMISAET